MPETLTLTPSESLTIERSTPELLEVEATYGPRGSPPPAHLHPSQNEHFAVREGAIRVRVDGAERELSPGDEVDIRHGAAHQMWNPGDEPARVLWQTRPGGRTERWFRAIDSLHREGRVGRNGIPGPLAMGALLTEYRDTFRLAVRPRLLVRAGVELLGLLGRLRGY